MQNVEFANQFSIQHAIERANLPVM
jgi:hypothetical protein